MNDLTKKEAAYDPQELERLLVARENAGDVDGMTALFTRGCRDPAWRWKAGARQGSHSRIFYRAPSYWVRTRKTQVPTRRATTGAHLR